MGGRAPYPSGMDHHRIVRPYLAATRAALLWKVTGLSERDLRAPRTPTGTNLLGIVKHCAWIQHGYFGMCLGREPGFAVPGGDGSDPNADLYATAEESPQQILAAFRRVGEYAEATLAELPPETPARVPWWGPNAGTTLGRLAVHVLADLARHAGHADILREQIDGAAGIRRDNDNFGEPADGWAAHVGRLQALADAAEPGA